MDNKRGLLIALIYLIIVLLSGIAGFVHFEDKSILDSFYLVVICLSTVGMSSGVEITTAAGKLITVYVIVSGVGIVTYLLSSGAKIIIGGELRQVLGKRKMQKKLKNMKDHFIVCGVGESSLQIMKEFDLAKVNYVLIDIDEEKVRNFLIKGYTIVHGDAETEETLKLAGIEKAKGLIANLEDDSHNIFAVLTARTLNEKLFIVAKAGKTENVEKLKKVGADRVVSPSIIGGRRMAASLLKTSVVDFLDVVTKGGEELELQMDCVPVTETGELHNRMLKDSGIRTKSGVIVVALKCNNDLFVNPKPETLIKTGTSLIVLGRTEQINKLIEIA